MPDGERKSPIIPPTEMTPEQIAKALLRPVREGQRKAASDQQAVTT